MTLEELLKLTREQFKQISPNDFLDIVNRFSTEAIREARIYEAKTRLYRARKLISSPNNISNMSYPPVEYAKIGRANQKDQQIFYACAGLSTTFNECRVIAHEDIFVSEWEATSQMCLQVIGFESNINPLESLLHRIFTCKDESMYEYSAAISEHLLSGTCIDGILYPSIISNNFSHNVALKKAFVDDFLKIINVRHYKVLSVDNTFQYKVEEVDFATVNKNGDLMWKNRTAQYVINENYGTLIFKKNNWGFDVSDQDGILVDPV